MHKVTSIFICKKLQQIVILLLPAASIGSKMQLTLSGGECGLYPLPPCLGFAPQSQRDWPGLHMGLKSENGLPSSQMSQHLIQ